MDNAEEAGAADGARQSRWLAVGFLLAYATAFIYPTFLATARMRDLPDVPFQDVIGGDFQWVLDYCAAWISGQSPYFGPNLYPPVTLIAFSPFLLLDKLVAYRLITLISVACFLLLVLWWPGATSGRRGTREVAVIAATGITSYGFRFELERGQFNVLAGALCLTAVWLFHHRHQYRFVAYGLLTAAAQLKVYPLIFMLLMVRQWNDWRGNFTRFAGILAVNGALLLVLGWQIFQEFLVAIAAQMATPYVWYGNHSVRSFTALLYYGIETGISITTIETSATEVALLLFVIGGVAVTLAQAWRRQVAGIDGPLLMACTIGALVIPSVSHDYKLPLLAAPAAFLAIDRREIMNGAGARAVVTSVWFLIGAAYASTLASFNVKPTLFLRNNLPALLVILTGAVVLAVLTRAAGPDERLKKLH